MPALEMPARMSVSPRKLASPSRIADRLGRESWVSAARAELISRGHASIKVDRLATSLKVTRGGFYWHFKDRADLLDALLADWESTNSAAILAALRGGGSPGDRLRALGRVWLDEREYSPGYDARIAALEPVFADAGYPADEAFIRARITYFHQVGYYAMGVRETRDVRDRYLGLYLGVLIGQPSERGG